MLDLKDVARSFEDVVARLATRGGALDLDRFQALFQRRKALYVELEASQAARNRLTVEIEKDRSKAPALGAEVSVLKKAIKEHEAQLAALEAELEALMLTVPNLPHPSVPVGADEQANQVVRTWGEKPTFLFTPRAHHELGEKLGMLDFGRAAKVSGTRFAYLTGALARLERALVSFMLDAHAAKGYVEVVPPYLVGRGAMMGTGQLPKFEADAFKTAGDRELFLIPTAEVPVTNYFADEILDGPLPVRFAAFSPCFRSEAGSAGKDTRGYIRMHQFHKVELVWFSRPEDSQDALEQLTCDAAAILEALELPYRVVALSTGDLGFAAEKTYDLEVWLPGQEAYREISSCSCFGDFQARRAKIRYRPGPKDKPRLVHTLNGSALAIGRTVVAIIENYQREDGSIAVPRALVPYLGGMTTIGPKGP